MKKFLIAISALLLFFVFSCANKQETTTTKNDQTENMNAKSRAVYKAIETGDVSGLDSVIDKNIVDHDPYGKSGLDSLKAMLGDIHNHFKNLKCDVIAQANNGEYHFTLFTFSGTPTDNSMGMEPGKAVSMKAVDVVKMKDGKATEHWGFTDNAEMVKMMPSMPPPPMKDTTKVIK